MPANFSQTEGDEAVGRDPAVRASGLGGKADRLGSTLLPTDDGYAGSQPAGTRPLAVETFRNSVEQWTGTEAAPPNLPPAGAAAGGQAEPSTWSAFVATVKKELAPAADMGIARIAARFDSGGCIRELMFLQRTSSAEIDRRLQELTRSACLSEWRGRNEREWVMLPAIF